MLIIFLEIDCFLVTKSNCVKNYTYFLDGMHQMPSLYRSFLRQNKEKPSELHGFLFLMNDPDIFVRRGNLPGRIYGLLPGF